MRIIDENRHQIGSESKIFWNLSFFGKSCIRSCLSIRSWRVYDHKWYRFILKWLIIVVDGILIADRRDRSKIWIVYLRRSYTFSKRSYTSRKMIILYDFSFRYPYELTLLLSRFVQKVTQAADIKTSFCSIDC